MSDDKIFDIMVKQLSSQVFHGGQFLKELPKTIRAVLGENRWQKPMWMERVDKDTGEVYAFSRFEDFVTAPPTAGVGASVKMIQDICQGDPVAMDMLDQALKTPVGRPKKNSTNRDNLKRTPNESQQGTLRTLRKNAPELHAKVLSGDMTIAEAAKVSGIRKRRVSIYLTSASSAAATIRNNATPEFIADLINELKGEHHA